MLGYLWYAGLFGLVSGSLAVVIALVRRDQPLLTASAWFLVISGVVAAIGAVAIVVAITNDPS
jgi:hypothetical protein